MAQNGAKGMLRQMLVAQKAAYTGQEARYYSLAQVSACLNRRETQMLAVTVDQTFVPLRSDSAFEDIARRVRERFEISLQ